MPHTASTTQRGARGSLALQHRRGTDRTGSSRRGNALVAALMLLTVVAVMLAGLLETTVDTSTTIVRRVDRFGGKRTASSINRLTAQQIWTSYETQLAADETPRIVDLRVHLDGLGLTNQAGVDPQRVEFVNNLALAQVDGQRVLGNAAVESVLVHREDEGRNTLLFITTTADGTKGGEQLRETLTDVFNLGAPIWDGLDFALLANNVNCILCHTQVDDVRRVYASGDAVDGGGIIRARVGAIESFQIRQDPQSMIAGTMYLGRDAIDDRGDTITDWSNFSLGATELDEHGSVEMDQYGNTQMVDMSPADAADPEPYENLYTNYLDQDEPVDGELPESFPLPFQDDGGFDIATGAQGSTGEGNRIVDDLEFETTVYSFEGGVSGGAIGVVNSGSSVSSASEARTLASGNTQDLGAVTRGSVVLTGSENDPIRIDGRVAIDGDLIISGPIEGMGSLWVRGNIYVRGDLSYNDIEVGGGRAFGTGPNGPNALGLTAGGNVIMGDMYRGMWGEGTADGTPSSAWNFTLEQTAIFNRGEWLKTQEQLPGQPVEVQVGTETRTREILVEVTETTPRDIVESRPTGRTITQPVYEQRQTGTREEPVYEQRQTGTRQEQQYKTVTIRPGTPYEETKQVPNGFRDVPVYENVQTGTRTVPVYENVQTGTREVDEYENVVVGTEDVVTTRMASQSPPVFEDYEVPIMEWQTPMFDNPDFRGADYLPRYYGFGEGDPIPIPTGDGYFDPDKNRWVAPEMVPEWTTDGLELADPTDPNDPLLNPATGQPAVVQYLEPTADWMADDALKALIDDELSARNPNDPFNVDATIYSSNSLFGIVPDDPSDGTNGELQVQGAVLGADVGLLGPNGTDINYDPRGRDVLQILDEDELGLRTVGTLPSPLP